MKVIDIWVTRQMFGQILFFSYKSPVQKLLDSLSLNRSMRSVYKFLFRRIERFLYTRPAVTGFVSWNGFVDR